MKKIILQLAFILFVCGSTQSQTIQLGSGHSIRRDTIAKDIIDNAKYRIFYSMSYAEDSTFIEDRTECQTILLIGSKHNAFLDYNDLRRDSISEALLKAGEEMSEVINQALKFSRFAKFRTTILKNYPEKGSSSIQTHIAARETHRYTDQFQFNWTLEEGEKEIAGYLCKRASCSFRGREYTAWYAPEIPISEGPYAFNGLPGLILELSDTRNHYRFMVNGITQVNTYDPIYYATRNVINTSREQTRKALQRIKDNPGIVLQSMQERIEIPDETAAAAARTKSRPYNPIELE